MRRAWRARGCGGRACALAVAAVVAAPGAGGCGASKTTRITTEDILGTTSEIAAGLAGAAFLVERGPGSERMSIAVRRAENLSSDVIADGEAWILVERVASSLPLATLARERNLVFVIPRERARESTGAGATEFGDVSGRAVTHVLGATVYSVTRAAREDRTDLYSIEYRVEDLRTREVVWSERVEYKRAARGKGYD